MTPAEQARYRDVMTRLKLLEKENKRLRALYKGMCTRRRKAVDEGRRLHGILMMHGIEVRQ